MTSSNQVIPEMEDNESLAKKGKYGWACFKSRHLQCFNNIRGFVLAYSVFAIVVGTQSNGFVSLNVSSLERRFGFDSTLSGVVVTGYDIGFCLACVFVSYFGSQGHKPHILAVGGFLYAVGCLIYAIPHFTSPTYVNDETFSDTCSNATNVSCPSVENSSENNLYILLLGTLLCGAAAVPLLTLGLAYVEDSTSKHEAPIYLGVCNGAIILGPAIGFLLGGFLLRSVYVDFNVVDAESVTLVETDPRWVGAWWLGPLFMMGICLLNAVFLAGFPRYLPGTLKQREGRNAKLPKNSGHTISEKQDFGTSIRDFPKATLVLLKNSTLVFATLASCFDAMVINGFSAFMSKFIENAFHQTSGSAAIWAGVILVPGGLIGHIAGGWIIGKLKMGTEQVIKFCIITSLLTTPAIFSAFLYCDNTSIAGVTSHYNNGSYDTTIPFPIFKSNLTAQCNAGCGCQEEFFNSVCGSDNKLYFSACHAGCSSSSNDKGPTFYSDCTCVKPTSASSRNATAHAGLCPSSCNTLGIFLAIFFFVIAFALTTLTGTLILTFRVTPHVLKPFALGLQWIVVRILGSIPGPIIYGAIFDFSCILWQKKRCGGLGSCWIYDSKTMAVYMIVLSAAAKLMSAALFFGALLTFKKQTTDKETNDVGRNVNLNKEIATVTEHCEQL